MTVRQALFIKYLVTRFDYSYFCHGPNPENIFGDTLSRNPGTSFRNTAMYYYARYPIEIKGNWEYKDYKNLEGKWWNANFITSQIDGCILIDEAKDLLGKKHKKHVEGTNW